MTAHSDIDGSRPSRSGGTPESDDGIIHRRRKAYLAAQRGELLTPVHAVVDTCERLLTGLGADGLDEFVADLQVIQRSGEELLALIVEILHPERLDAATDEDFQQMQSRLRHDMLNKLNPIINYSEMWLEDSDASELQPHVADLQMICSSGRHCYRLVDKILASWDTENVQLSAQDAEMVSCAVDRMFNPAQNSHTHVETGRLLVVDDNETNREVLQRRLTAQGHDVRVAHNGTQALDMLRTQDFDLVLLDILMPEIDGFDVLVRVKSDEALRDIPVIMISALDEMDVVVRCIESGAEDYLQKPFNPVMLKARISACLEKKRLREREVEHLQQIDRERQRADELLHVILPSDIVDELKRNDCVVPRRYDDVAVLFADIVNFTPYCDRNPPEEVVSLLQDLVVRWEEVARRHHVEKIKTIGDAFMAVGGLFDRRGNPVLNCLRTGAEMIESIRTLSDEWDLRVGIHCGHVVGGVLGRRQYLFDLWGDTVNIAARMESHGLAGHIILSETAWNKVQAHAHGTCIREQSIKGKGSMDVYRFDGFVESAPSCEANEVGMRCSIQDHV